MGTPFLNRAPAPKAGASEFEFFLKHARKTTKTGKSQVRKKTGFFFKIAQNRTEKKMPY